MFAASRIVFLDSGSNTVRFEKFYYKNINFLFVVTIHCFAAMLDSTNLGLKTLKLSFHKMEILSNVRRIDAYF